MESRLENYLKEYDIHYIEHSHSAVFTVEEHKNVKVKIPGLHTKSLFLQDELGRFYLVCMPAEKRLNIKQLEKHFSLKKLRFGSPGSLKSELNLTPGSVSVFGMIFAKNTTLILDQEVWDSDKVGFHPNINTSTLEISHQDLEKFYNSLKCEKCILKI